MSAFAFFLILLVGSMGFRMAFAEEPITYPMADPLAVIEQIEEMPEDGPPADEITTPVPEVPDGNKDETMGGPDGVVDNPTDTLEPDAPNGSVDVEPDAELNPPPDQAQGGTVDAPPPEDETVPPDTTAEETATGTLEEDVAAIRSMLEFVLFGLVPLVTGIALIVWGCKWFSRTFFDSAFE